MKTNFTDIKKITIILVLIFWIIGAGSLFAQVICIEPGTSDQRTGELDGYRYELWNQNAQGTACMTLGEGALFSGEWSGILNYLARRGLGYNQTQEHQEIGIFEATYDCDYNPSTASGNSYLSVYGWTVEPLIEYYIVEDWRNWIPSMAETVVSMGTFEIDGSVYDVYENTRTNQPSIVGDATFQQYFSIRRDVRNSGTISISEHFNHWELLGMDLGKLHEVSFVVEGYESSGSFEFNALEIIASDIPAEEPDPTTPPVEEPNPITGVEEETSKLFKIYPNPSNGNIFIQLGSPFSNVNVEVYDVVGNLVFSRQNMQENRIQISSLTSGMYFINVQDDKGSHKAKFLVN